MNRASYCEFSLHFREYKELIPYKPSLYLKLNPCCIIVFKIIFPWSSVEKTKRENQFLTLPIFSQ